MKTSAYNTANTAPKPTARFARFLPLAAAAATAACCLAPLATAQTQTEDLPPQPLPSPTPVPPIVSTGAKPRNVIFILSDDHRYDFMGFMGRVPWLQTPNMDRLARDGAHIKNAFVTTSLCSPSRATILTGLYAHQHQVVDNQAAQPPGLVFFPQYLQKAGYRTAFFGKWHMGGEIAGDNDSPRPGFDHWEGFRGQGIYYGVTLNIDGKRITYGQDVYTTDLLTEHAIDWLKQQRRQDPNKPFFLYLSHKAVHDDFTPPARYKDCYKNKEVPLPPNFKTPYYGIKTPPTRDPATGKPASGPDYYGPDMQPTWVKNQRESWHGVDYAYHGREDWQDNVRRYCETLRGVDDSIGAVLDYLKQTGQLENTLVIYMGDNGFAWGEHGLIDKRQFFEESTRVPMLAYCPEIIKPGTIVRQMVLNLDIAPTILDAAGIQKPANMPGASMLPLLQGKQVAWRDRFYYEYYWEYEYPQTPTMFGVRTDDYKLIRYREIWDTDEFFDMKNDPYEMHNLIAEPKYQKIIKQLSTDIEDWLEQTNGMFIPLKRTDRPHLDHRNIGTY